MSGQKARRAGDPAPVRLDRRRRYQAPGGGGQGRGGDGAQVIQVDKLKDNLFVLRGGGNTVVFVGSDGVTVVDTKIPGWGQPLIAKIKELTAKPVIRIINSHTHA